MTSRRCVQAYAASFAPSRWLDSDYCDAVARGDVTKGVQI